MLQVLPCGAHDRRFVSYTELSLYIREIPRNQVYAHVKKRSRFFIPRRFNRITEYACCTDEVMLNEELKQTYKRFVFRGRDTS